MGAMTGLARSGAARPAIPSQGMAGWVRAVKLAPEGQGFGWPRPAEACEQP